MTKIFPEKPEHLQDLCTEDVEKEINKIPLFMQEYTEDTEDSIAIQALQSLKFDGTPEENALNFKDQGNICFSQGKRFYPNAIRFYTDAIDQNCNDYKLISKCYANRAAVNLKLENYGKVVKDCLKAIELEDKNVKAYYRASLAYNKINKFELALYYIQNAILLEPKTPAFEALLDELEDSLKKVRDKEKTKIDKSNSETRLKQKTLIAIKARDVKFINQNDQICLPVIDLTKIIYDTKSYQLTWACFFLYPEFNESDYLEDFNESESFLEKLDIVFEFPAPWDKNHNYSKENIQLFFSVNDRKSNNIVKFESDTPLFKILSHPSYFVKEIPSFFILTKKSSFSHKFLASYNKIIEI